MLIMSVFTRSRQLTDQALKLYLICLSILPTLQQLKARFHYDRGMKYSLFLSLVFLLRLALKRGKK